jgi:hypothetical protein
MKYTVLFLSIFLTACTPLAAKKEALKLEIPPELLEEPAPLKKL